MKAKHPIENYEKLKSIICKVLNITYNDAFNSTSRRRKNVEARQIFCSVVKNNSKLSFTEIGEKVYKSNKFSYDHATVMYGATTVNNLCSTDIEFNEKYKKILKDFYRYQNYQYKSMVSHYQTMNDKLNSRIKSRQLIY
jgi:chromosomal replication initiation ATPase DnaA